MLPESVVFLCKLCGSEEKRKVWQEAIEVYLDESLVKVGTCVVTMVHVSLPW